MEEIIEIILFTILHPMWILTHVLKASPLKKVDPVSQEFTNYWSLDVFQGLLTSTVLSTESVSWKQTWSLRMLLGPFIPKEAEERQNPQCT